MVEVRADAGQGSAGQFHDAAQRRRADQVGMWLFLGTEAMLFSGLFAALLVYRIMYPAEAKDVSRHLQLWIAAANTAILLTGSFTVAAAGVLLRHGVRAWTALCLVVTGLLGVLFLALKAMEYVIDIRDGIVPGHAAAMGSKALFVNLYYAATGLHAIHLTIGVVWLMGLAVVVARRRRPLHAHVHIAGLYWHFVDVIWIFLYPTLYLMGRNGT
jgi:cytochrome c oxidase subunit 3